MLHQASRWITRIFNPLIMPTLAASILLLEIGQLSASLSGNGVWMVILLIAGTTFLLPSSFILFMLRIGTISAIEVPDRRERILPSIITALIYYGTYHLLTRVPVHPVIPYYMLGATLMMVITLFITYFWKISLHMCALGGLSGTLTGISILTGIPLLRWIIPALILSGVVGVARLHSGAHKPAQVYAGFLLGFLFFTLLFLAQAGY